LDTSQTIPATPDAGGQSAGRPAAQRALILISGAALVGVFVWTYWRPIGTLVDRWWNDADYVYGFLVPPAAAAILWVRRGMLASFTPRGSLWGLPLIALAGAMRWVSAYYYFALVDPMSIVPLAAGLVLFVGGWRALHWAAPAIALLVFMVPLPGFVAGALSHPLQRIGTIAATYTLQTIGLPATAQGNIIRLGENELGVVEACSGLRMMMLFFAVCFAAAFLVKRPVLDRTVLILSAAPVALAANVVRIVTTGILYETVGQEAGDALFHDLAGWFMMPLAVVLLWGEMKLLDCLLIPAETDAAATARWMVSGGRASPQGQSKSGKTGKTSDKARHKRDRDKQNGPPNRAQGRSKRDKGKRRRGSRGKA